MTATLTEPPGWGEPGSIRHAEEIGHTVWMQEHPELPGQDAIDDLARAMERTRAAREPFAEPEQCGVRAIGAVCCRPVHEVWEQHETWDGHTWFSGEAPR